jgi:hypothetical protein
MITKTTVVNRLKSPQFNYSVCRRSDSSRLDGPEPELHPPGSCLPRLGRQIPRNKVFTS